MSEGPISLHRLAVEVRDDVRLDLPDVLHDVHLWVPGADYFGPVWVDAVGWVIPQGWEPPHGWAPPPGWYEPACWAHDDYREWCDNHYSSDHDWRGWENCDHFQDHDNWHGWVPGADYFGPVWVDGVGWVVPQGWEPPYGWAPPPGWYQPAYWVHDDYHRWCDNHYSSDHDWRGWENSYHWGEHNQWHGWNDHDRDDRDHRSWNDHDRDDRDHRSWNDHDRDDNRHVQHEDRDPDHQHSGLRQDDRGLQHDFRSGHEVRDFRSAQHQAGQESRGQVERDVQRGVDGGRNGYGVARGEPGYQHGQFFEGAQNGPANSVAPVASTFSAPAPSFASGAVYNGASVSPNMAPSASAPAVATTTAAASAVPVNATPVDPRSSAHVASEPLSHSVRQAATVNTTAYQPNSDSRSGSPRGDQSSRGTTVNQDSSQSPGHHSGGYISGSGGQNGQQNAHPATGHGQQGGAPGGGPDSGQHGGFTGAPQADTGAPVDAGHGAPGQPSHHPAAPQADLGGSTSQPAHPATPTPHDTAPGTSNGAPSSGHASATPHATATPQSTPTTHSTAPGTSSDSASSVHSTPTTHSTAPSTVHSSDPNGAAGASSSHGLSSGLTTHDSGQAAAPATHDPTHPGTDHTAVPH